MNPPEAWTLDPQEILGTDIAAHRKATTPFVTTHYLDEAEYCKLQVSIMVDGRIDALDSPAALKARYGAYTMDEVFRKSGPLPRILKKIRKNCVYIPVNNKRKSRFISSATRSRCLLCCVYAGIILLLLFRILRFISTRSEQCGCRHCHRQSFSGSPRYCLPDRFQPIFHLRGMRCRSRK